MRKERRNATVEGQGKGKNGVSWSAVSFCTAIEKIVRYNIMFTFQACIESRYTRIVLSIKYVVFSEQYFPSLIQVKVLVFKSVYKNSRLNIFKHISTVKKRDICSREILLYQIHLETAIFHRVNFLTSADAKWRCPVWADKASERKITTRAHMGIFQESWPLQYVSRYLKCCMSKRVQIIAFFLEIFPSCASTIIRPSKYLSQLAISFSFQFAEYRCFVSSTGSVYFSSPTLHVFSSPPRFYHTFFTMLLIFLFRQQFHTSFIYEFVL